jgi:hypothetical protein
MAPRDIPPVQKRSTIDEADSTLPIGIGARSLLNSRRSRRTYERGEKKEKKKVKTREEDGIYACALVL